MFINENENFIKFSYTLEKKWYNSDLTYQNLRQDKENQIFSEDKTMMWLPWFENINMENREKCKQTEKSDVLKIIPNKNFSFKRNPYTDHINAFLFEGPKKNLS